MLGKYSHHSSNYWNMIGVEPAGLCHVLYPNKAAGWKPQMPTAKYLWICGLTVLIVACC
jgi:hypothetical protein